MPGVGLEILLILMLINGGMGWVVQLRHASASEGYDCRGTARPPELWLRPVPQSGLAELGLSPRPINGSLVDAVAWLRETEGIRGV